MIAFLLILGLFFTSRAMNEKATKKLDQDKKAALIDLFSESRISTFGILIGIIIFFFISLEFKLLNPLLTYVIYIIMICAFLIITSYLSYKKLKENNFPDFYIKYYILSTSIRFVGLVIFFLLLKY